MIAHKNNSQKSKVPINRANSHIVSKTESVWDHVTSKYQLLEKLGQGTYGQVRKVKHIASGKIYAIKLIENCFNDEYSARKAVREIKILRQLSVMNKNVFTTRLHEIILPNHE